MHEHLRLAYRGVIRCLAYGLLPVAVGVRPAPAQEGYEIEVYQSTTQAAQSLMLETQGNYTFQGQRLVVDGVVPTRHATHALAEATLGLTAWSEVGAYVFTSSPASTPSEWAGSSLRYRVRAPEAWNWPLGVSLSSEVEYTQPHFSEEGWALEIRPIVDTYRGRWYVSVNPTFERGWSGTRLHRGMEFTPSVKSTFDITQRISAGFEYYAEQGEGRSPVMYSDVDTVVVGTHPTGPSFSRVVDNDGLLHVPEGERQQLYGVMDLHLSAAWEVNLGVGVGTTASTDHLVAKFILGRSLSWGPPPPP